MKMSGKYEAVARVPVRTSAVAFWSPQDRPALLRPICGGRARGRYPTRHPSPEAVNLGRQAPERSCRHPLREGRPPRGPSDRDGTLPSPFCHCHLTLPMCDVKFSRPSNNFFLQGFKLEAFLSWSVHYFLESMKFAFSLQPHFTAFLQHRGFPGDLAADLSPASVTFQQADEHGWLRGDCAHGLPGSLGSR